MPPIFIKDQRRHSIHIATVIFDGTLCSYCYHLEIFRLELQVQLLKEKCYDWDLFLENFHKTQ